MDSIECEMELSVAEVKKRRASEADLQSTVPEVLKLRKRFRQDEMALEDQVSLEEFRIGGNDNVMFLEPETERMDQISLKNTENLGTQSVKVGREKFNIDRVSKSLGNMVFDNEESIDITQQASFEMVVESPEQENEHQPRCPNPADGFNEDSDDDDFVVHPPNWKEEVKKEPVCGDHFHYYKERTILDEVNALYADPANGLYYNGVVKEFKLIDYKKSSKICYLRELVDLDYETLVYREEQGEYAREVHYLGKPLNVLGEIMAVKILHTPFNEGLKYRFRKIEGTQESMLKKLGYPMCSSMILGLDYINQVYEKMRNVQKEAENMEATEHQMEQLDLTGVCEESDCEEDDEEVAENMADEPDNLEINETDSFEMVEMDEIAQARDEEYDNEMNEWIMENLAELEELVEMGQMEDVEDWGEVNHRNEDETVRALFRRHGYADTDTDFSPIFPSDVPFEKLRRTPPPIKGLFAIKHCRSFEKLEPAEVERRRRLKDIIPAFLQNLDL
ncbi:unnamed protein product [Bursaphelenchus okinawaensis]|uniref:Uncharacterized protein n=1 Tax=Bursaphelenchus okinawaensis TaxID=465554 RepID=A0A811LDF7_9BILA|nr:unnamed protein product [Bursaphelenchus okinawaensis]CAG9120634.1 unnamed protein product [Bursaphelenchus okinawaensis]